MIRLSIVCDCCKRVGAEGHTEFARAPRAHLLRGELRPHGWRKGLAGSDWCPECWRMLRQAKRLDSAGRLSTETDTERTERIVRETLAQYDDASQGARR